MKSKKTYHADIDFGGGEGYDAHLQLHTTTYRNNGTLAVFATEDDEDFATLTVNILFQKTSQFKAARLACRLPFIKPLHNGVKIRGFATPVCVR